MMRDVLISASNATVRVRGKKASGSGTIIDMTSEKVMVVTCNHVVEGGDKVRVGHGKKSWRGVVLARYPERDLALIGLDIPAANFKGLAPIAGDPEEKSLIVLSGNPGNFEDIVVEGRYQGKTYTKGQALYLITVPAIVIGGVSGGPVVNEEDGLVGILTAGDVQDGVGFSSIGHVIPANIIKRFVNRAAREAIKAHLAKQDAEAAATTIVERKEEGDGIERKQQ